MEEFMVTDAQEHATLGIQMIHQVGEQQMDNDASQPSTTHQLNKDVDGINNQEPVGLDTYIGAHPPEKYDAAAMEWSVLKANAQQSSIFLRHYYSDWAHRIEGGREEILSLVFLSPLLFICLFLITLSVSPFLLSSRDGILMTASVPRRSILATLPVGSTLCVVKLRL